MRTITCAFISLLIGFWWLTVCHAQKHLLDFNSGMMFCLGIVVANVIQFVGAFVVFVKKEIK